MHTRSPVIAQDLSAEQRWGEFPRVALEAGAQGVCAFPLEAAGQVIGALSLYAHQPNLFPEPVQRIAAQFVEPAAILLTGVLRHLTQAELIERLRATLAARGAIDQAIGIIMAQRRCRPQEAFHVLRAISNHRNVKLRKLAVELVETVATGASLPGWASSSPRPEGGRATT